ncbi:MAG: alpha/beta hydrolase [Acidobacteria bacterium]|nr:alpha/beta hydrolase [Acidobacteriota bacterium]
MPKVKVGDINLSFEVEGEGPPLIIVNGGGASVAQMKEIGATDQKILEAGYKLIRFDNRGIPPSDAPSPPYTINQMADDTIGLLEYLDSRPYNIMGRSMGGLITQTVALKRPDLVNSAIFISGIGNQPVFAKIFSQAFLDLLENRDIPKSILKTLMLIMYIPQHHWDNDDIVSSTLEILSGFISASNESNQSVLGHSTAACNWMKEDHVSELAGLKVPVLAIANEFDIYFPPSFVQKAVSIIPKAEYVEIGGASHVSMNPEHEGRIISAVLDFFSRQTSNK